MHALWTAATGMEALKFKIDVIANNLSNTQTEGFKRSDAEFTDLLYQYYRRPGSVDNPSGIHYGLGSRIAGTNVVHQQGSLQSTNNNLDWAIDGIGFFSVLDPISGQRFYTRKGLFKLNNNGQVVNADGYTLDPNITIPPGTTDFHIDRTGVFWATQPGTGLLSQLGNITLTRFPNPAGLEARGNSLFAESSASGSPEQGQPAQNGFGQIHGRALESSNVQIVTEMVDLITTQKAFDTNSKVITVADKMMDTANNLSR
ncbi:flagellar basal-body rod protein FlgG [bacterium (Candidatus Blackallbacteria) CG17_big_fil_post_rev_8_21_14_2_50_48_46]|uniref:Flagellar basal-body rod protein FlgG n=1 Tax=bacterium (Candidatus Blackallbacteria) CG17_big_fil_post_rev_8_21_14_2_50_48_46 TaxID=2014261 RepID=A0A2M7G802_9BACT|nr:MAG: flagellar basal-body rod protein FlgG [bacterium (Candidatus Blackallbacteria) CG18_big_fil_WC_8_21_14_2_50_49_26]PIW18133.1 MAG: flagellar basal-body rod protein FlgG [bacterium (Candidatus Blackallbacteria) CG17_big_fil_post_rev_8_21_14_2_50_48_46]PIW47032.1 MAG: flagellar basal-body rod protein FlgG [bacterium (Candidatus Blackallbacteria) CG13_big_fil_rev_8_21_14_2_50_49_14]